MLEKALEYIACPLCKQKLNILEISSRKELHTMTGALACHHCNETYPIENGIPRLLSPEVTKEDKATGVAYDHYYAKVVPEKGENDKLYGKTVREEVRDFRLKTGISDLNLLDGKIFLDAGCGLARIEGSLSKHCQEVFAFDISPSVERAFATWETLPNVHIIQGDLTHIPFKANRFDLVWCDGALPYVSNLSVAIYELLETRKLSGFLYSWCYDASEVKLNHRLGHWFHRTNLPIGIRYYVIYITCWLIKAAVSIKHRENMIKNVHLFAQGVLDASLSGSINYVTKEQIQQLLSKICSHDNPSIHVTKKGRHLDFRVGSLG
jgi:uncharacterized protein YbaR (Trm112 family)/SAM-dependent methyltransferase